MLDETRCEFGVSFEAEDEAAAYDYLRNNYEESRVDELHSLVEWAEKERAMYNHIARGGDYDEEGRAIYNYDYDWEDEDE